MRTQEKKYSWALKYFISSLIISKLLNILHGPYVDEILLVAALVIFIFYPLRYLSKRKKVLEDHLKLLLLVSFSGMLILDIFFEPFNKELMLKVYVVYSIGFNYWLFTEGSNYFNMKKYSKAELKRFDEESQREAKIHNLVNTLIYLFLAGLILGALFKIMHWPYANLLITASMLNLSIIPWFKKI